MYFWLDHLSDCLSLTFALSCPQTKIRSANMVTLELSAVLKYWIIYLKLVVACQVYNRLIESIIQYGIFSQLCFWSPWWTHPQLLPAYNSFCADVKTTFYFFKESLWVVELWNCMSIFGISIENASEWVQTNLCLVQCSDSWDRKWYFHLHSIFFPVKPIPSGKSINDYRYRLARLSSPRGYRKAVFMVRSRQLKDCVSPVRGLRFAASDET